jgi:high-affinity nickel permease
MGALDDWIAGLGQGGSIGVVLLVAVLLGLRHATDPDHLTAVSTLIVADRRHGTARARRLGLAWGAGHATTLLVFGLPIVLFGAYLPEKLQSAAELTIGLIIAVLAVRLLLRWRRGALLCHDDVVNGTPATAYGIGLVHGVGGSAGVGVILLSAISSEVVSAAALALFAVATAVSMALASALFGLALARGPVRALAPVIGSAGLLFGAWYAFAAL